MKWKLIGSKRSWSNLRYYSDIFLDHKVTLDISKDSYCYCRDSNLASTEYKSVALPHKPTASVHSVVFCAVQYAQYEFIDPCVYVHMCEYTYVYICLCTLMNVDLHSSLFVEWFTTRILSSLHRYKAMCSIFWDLTPCNLLKVNWSFKETCRLHLQCWSVSQAGNQYETSSKQSKWLTGTLGYIETEGSLETNPSVRTHKAIFLSSVHLYADIRLQSRILLLS
jgi:hypothetical protein